MASVPRSRRDDDDRSAGGKIVRSRRGRPTPYSRPVMPPAVDSADLNRNPGNPNYWLSGLMLPAKLIASGAGKVFSTVFGADAESSSSDEEDEDDGDSVCEGDDNEEDALQNQANQVTPSSIENSENKHLIQQLVSQEAFSSEEGEELIRLIKSRIVNDGRSLKNTETTPETRTAAIMEAKKWLEDKKSESELKSKLNDQFYASDQAMVLGDDIGSPVDVAKSYMQTRSAWSPQSTKHIEFGTPSTAHSSKEEKFKSIYPNSIQLSETRRSSLLSGSWDILEEIRRVRSKATEELLATTPSKKDGTLIFPEGKSNEGEPNTGNRDEAVTGDQLHNLTPAAVNSENMQVEPDGLGSKALPANGNSSAYNQYEDDEAVQVVEDTSAKADPGLNFKQLDGDTSLKETEGSRYYPAENGFPSGASSFAAGEDRNDKSHDQEMEVDHPAEKTAALQEPVSPIPAVSPSQNSSSMLNEESTRVIRSTPKRKAAVVAEQKGATQLKTKPRNSRESHNQEKVADNPPAEKTAELKESVSPIPTLSLSQNSSSMLNEESTRVGRSTPKRKAAVVAENLGAAQLKAKPRNTQESHDQEMATNHPPAENTTVLQEPASPIPTVSLSQNSSSMLNDESTLARRSTPKRKAAVVAEKLGAVQVKPRPRKARAKKKDEEVK